MGKGKRKKAAAVPQQRQAPAHNLTGRGAAGRKAAPQYARNGRAYIEKLTSLKNEMDKSLMPFRGKKIVTFHEAFPYFAKDYGLEIAAVIEREPGSEPSAPDV